MFSLKEKVAIVTGASSGIGRAAARLFAEHGAAVVVGARRDTELAALVGDIRDDGGRAEFVAGDVCDEGFSEALVKKATDTYGRSRYRVQQCRYSRKSGSRRGHVGGGLA